MRWQLDPTSGLLFNASRVFASVQTPQTPLPGSGVGQFVEALPAFVGRRVDDSFIEVGMVAFQQRTLPDREDNEMMRPSLPTA